MIKVENTKITGFEAAVRGMRNPLNSWDKIDSGYCTHFSSIGCDECPIAKNNVCEANISNYILGPNDYSLMKKLWVAGTDHRKYLRMINVSFDLTAPLYMWKEFDTYKVGTVANSCSTMHKIHSREFTIDDFAHEYIDTEEVKLDKGLGLNSAFALEITIETLNALRDRYNETKDKKYWYQMIQLLPTSYLQKRTISLNYEVLAHMYASRKNHKLDEWREFCDWIKTLPYSEFITGEFE